VVDGRVVLSGHVLLLGQVLRAQSTREHTIVLAFSGGISGS
jgi:hypothetical protein